MTLEKDTLFFCVCALQLTLFFGQTNQSKSSLLYEYILFMNEMKTLFLL